LEGVHQQTLLGAMLTLVTTVLVLFLLFTELSSFFTIETISRMDIDKRASFDAVKLAFDISFHKISCERIAYSHEVTKGMLHITENGEIIKSSIDAGSGIKGCSVHGFFLIDKVAGNFKFGVSDADINLDLSHTIHLLDFIPAQGLLLDSEKIGVPSHFNRSLVAVPTGSAAYQYSFYIVPTEYKTLYGKLSFINQYAVSEKSISFEHSRVGDMSLGIMSNFAGVVFNYDYSPVMLFLEERREKIIDFIANLFGIIGGVITVLSLIERFLQGSAKAIIGKKD
jgi:hypothetical protein